MLIKPHNLLPKNVIKNIGESSVSRLVKCCCRNLEYIQHFIQMEIVIGNLSFYSFSSSKKLRKKSGVIYSPLWPKRSSSLYKKCGWDIELSQAYVIKVNFMDFDLLSTSSYDCKYSRERLKLKGKIPFSALLF